MEPRRITSPEAEAIRDELGNLDRPYEPGGPNPLIAYLRIKRALGDAPAKMVVGRDRRRRELGLGPIDDAEIQILVDAAADLEAMTLRRLPSAES